MTGQDLLAETVERLLNATPPGEDPWVDLAAGGFAWVSVPESAGGSGGDLRDAASVLRVAGRHATSAPIAETMLGGRLLAGAGLKVSGGSLAVVPGPGLAVVDGRLTGSAVVAWAAEADQVLAVVDLDGSPVLAAARPEQLGIERRLNMADEPRDDVRFDVALSELVTAPLPDGAADDLQRDGCLTRVVLAAGALQAISEMTIDYTSQRRQFGRPIATFQAVQHHLVAVAQSAVRASMAAETAVRTVQGGGGAWEVAAARVIVDEATIEGTRAAHQAHGAMGVTREYGLQRYTRLLWAWRHEYRQAREWRRWLGSEVASSGADALWPRITR
ncbi:hypothetical protein K6U06_03910 [Acidiferrimicrobium sp. IK]|uniref:acyl-CoA dehydrogenase n=1 Tax=Acidiferrimicrobium sp. IK TaxID=2871700 RepID=UPI0021CAF3AC|nr:acyl-CoA dehydrogenase [Acidiferrimicrobium sp. IK]MCU4183494.1 hypothetical protein [Acidiferrimicrobium sp. IK]